MGRKSKDALGEISRKFGREANHMRRKAQEMRPQSRLAAEAYDEVSAILYDAAERVKLPEKLPLRTED